MRNRIFCWVALCLLWWLAPACAPGSDTTQPAPNPPANANANRPAAATSPPAGPAPLSQFRVEWVSHQIPSEMQAGKDYKVTVTVRNAGEQTWPSTGVGDRAANQVSVSYHWLPATGDTPVVFEGARSPVPGDIAPGQTFTNNSVYVLAPNTPGSYRLQMTMIQELVAWFDQQGASTVTVPVTVR